MAPRRMSQRLKAAAAAASSSLPNLNDDVLLEIFVKLPIKSLSRFKCVSKSWGFLIQNPILVYRRMLVQKSFEFEVFQDQVGLHHISVDHENGHLTLIRTYKVHKEQLLSYSNGLVCLINIDAEPFILKVVNLTTRESIDLPPERYNNDESGEYHPRIDIGIDPSTKRYKIFYADCFFHPCYMETITLKPNSYWKTADYSKSIVSMDNCVNANGKLFWLSEDDPNRIIYLKLRNNKFGDIDLSHMINIKVSNYSLLEFEGYICLVERRLQKSGLVISNMWMLKDVENEVWVLMLKDVDLSFQGTKLSSLKWFKPSFLALNENIFVVVSYENENENYMFVINILNQEIKRLKLNGLPKGMLSWNNHVKNYCSLFELINGRKR